MERGRRRYVVAYDVTDDRRRRILVRCLLDYGRRVQYSVFEMALTPSLFDKLVHEIEARIDPTEDRVHVYPLCGTCAREALYLGRSSEEERPGDAVAIVL